MAAKGNLITGAAHAGLGATKRKTTGFVPFCGGPMNFSSLAGVKGALAEGEDVSGRGGMLAEIDLCGIGVPAVVATPGSPLTVEGFQVAFLLCSRECAKALCLASMVGELVAGREPNLSHPDALFGLRLKQSGDPSEARIAELMDAVMTALPRLPAGKVELVALKSRRVAYQESGGNAGPLRRWRARNASRPPR